MDTTLPEIAYVANYDKSPDAPPVIAVKRGEMGYWPIFTRATADELNATAGVTKAQAMAMHCGSMFGWETGSARAELYEKKFAELQQIEREFERD